MRTPLTIRFLIAATALLLGACQNQPSQPTAPEQSAASSRDAIQQLLQQAQRAAPPQRQRLQLEASQLLMASGHSEVARDILESIEPSQLNDSSAMLWHTLYAEALLALSLPEQALHALEQPRFLELLNYAPLQQQLQASTLRAEAFNQLGKHLASAQERIYISPLLSSKLQAELRPQIWHSLMYVDVEELKHYLTTAVEGDYRGWLELAMIAKNTRSDLELQLQQLDQWLAQRPNHPAANPLPDELVLIRTLAENRPQQIALLLPMSGKLAPFGKAIRDGFLAAYYQQRDNQRHVPALKIYDTELNGSVSALYQQAVAEGADFVVGPLDKQRVAELVLETPLTVPTLALNRLEADLPLPNQLYQFALAPTDEARQIAEIATAQNHHSAMILAPEGDWGREVANAFIQQWQQHEGTVASYQNFGPISEHSTVIKQGLNLDQSEQRARDLQNRFGELFEFTPRRRQDIDMIFMLAKSQEARSLKPLLEFHYAGEIPVFATSRIYSGTPNPTQDRDLNGIQFTDMPWILSEPSALASSIDRLYPNRRSLRRMFAMGVDAFMLHPRLPQLDALPNSRLFGETGVLRLNTQRELERELLQATIAGGKPRITPSTKLEDVPTPLSQTTPARGNNRL